MEVFLVYDSYNMDVSALGMTDGIYVKKYMINGSYHTNGSVLVI